MLNQLIVILRHIICQSIFVGNFVCGSASNVPEIVDSNLPEGYQAFSGVAYKFYNQSVAWDSARKACIIEDSNLAVVDSFQKYEYIMDMIKIGNRAGPHVGIYRPSTNSEWISATDGLPPEVIPWAPVTWVDNPANQCLAMWNDRTGVGADSCDLLRPYVCEITLSWT